MRREVYISNNGSLLHSRFQCRHATLLPTVGRTLRDDSKNGCVADYNNGGFRKEIENET